jgi:hypothetical protein
MDHQAIRAVTGSRSASGRVSGAGRLHEPALKKQLEISMGAGVAAKRDRAGKIVQFDNDLLVLLDQIDP